MAEKEETLKSNWYKAAKGLHYAKKGLQDFVSDMVDAFHKTILQKLPPNVQCNACTTKDVIKNKWKCPQNVCVAVKKEVEKVHRYSTPTFKNSNAQTWFNKSWELAKCFMPPGYSKSTKANDTDFSGLINVIVCHTDFQALITERLDQSGNNFEKARKARNDIMHSPNMKLSTNEMNLHFQLLIDVLSDQCCLQSLPKAQKAIQKLKKLQQDSVTITVQDKEKICKEYFEEVKKFINDEIQKIKEKTTENIETIYERTSEGTEKIDRKTNESTKTMQKEKEVLVERLRETVEESLCSLKRAAADLISEFKTALHGEIEMAKGNTENMKKEVEVLEQRIKGLAQSSIDTIKALQAESAKGPDQMVKHYNERKENLQKELIHHYIQNDYCKSAIPALIDDEEVDVADIFDMPKMRVKQSSSKDSGSQKDEEVDVADIFDMLEIKIKQCRSKDSGSQKDEEVDVADIFDMPKMRVKQSSSKDSGSQKDEGVDIADIFDTLMMKIKQIISKDSGSQKDEYQYINTIYGIFQMKRQRILRACISGEAGYGKTTLCQKILSNWCKLHTNQQIEGLQSIDKTFLKSFDFLFYIPLRNHTTPDITDMIKAELVRIDMHDILDEVLRRDSCKCFIILDGLDEWLPPENCGKETPNYDHREKMTILTTSRPWKLEVLRPKNREIGHEVKLCGVTDVNKCVMDIVDYLNKNRGEKKRLGDIFEEEQFRHFIEIPGLLTQIVCMWYDDMDFGKTRIDVYCRMIDYYLQMANKRQKHTTKQNSNEFSGLESRKTVNDCLLDIFRDLPFCKKYSDLLSRLSDLAFHTLFSEKKEDSLVFPHAKTEIYRLNEVDLTFCLKAGLLSQAKFCSKVTEQTKKLSFIHKTVQEFLAAVFIAHNDNKFKDILQKLSCLKDVFEMGEFLHFLGGLRPDLIYDMSNHIAVLTDKDEAVISYRKSIDDCLTSDLPEQIQNLIYEIVEEGCKCNKGGMVNKVIIRDIHFSRHDKRTKKIYEHIKGDEIKSFVMKYDCFDVLQKIKKLTQLLLLRIKFYEANLCKVSFVIETQADFDYLMDMLKNNTTSLTSLGIKESFGNHRRLDYQSFFSILMDTTCLTGISLKYIKLDHLGIAQMAQFLSSRTQFEEIQLEGIFCVTCRDIPAPCTYIIDLSNHQKLQWLDITRLSGQVTIRDGLPLQYCRVKTCECGPSFIACLTSWDSLQRLEVNGLLSIHQIHSLYTKREDDYSEASPSSSGLSTILITVIPTLRNLKELALIDIHFGQDLLRLSSDMKYLRSVKLISCIQTEESFKCFIDSLPETQGVLRVSLSADSIFQNNSDISRIAKNYLSQKYHKSHLEYPFIITFSNDNHTINLLSGLIKGNPEKPEILERFSTQYHLSALSVLILDLYQIITNWTTVD